MNAVKNVRTQYLSTRVAKTERNDNWLVSAATRHDPVKEAFALALTDLELAVILTIGAFNRSTRKPNPVVYSVVS